MKTVIESIGHVGSRALVGGHEVVFDQPAAVPGGQNRGPSPLDVMSVSVAACAHYFASAYLPPGLVDRHRAGIKRAIESCPAYGTLIHPPIVEISVEGGDQSGGEQAEDAGRGKRAG